MGPKVKSGRIARRDIKQLILIDDGAIQTPYIQPNDSMKPTVAPL